MADLSDYLEAALLDHLFGLATFTAPSTLYVALSTADPLDDGSGITEPVGGGYARVSVAAGAAQWTRTANEVVNDNTVSFPEATSSWGTITHAALYDAASGGNLLAHTALGSPAAVASNTVPRFAAGVLAFSLD